MFAKNLKHEMKATARVLVPLLACVLILGIVLGLAFAGIGMLSNIGDASADVGGNASPDTGSSQLDFSNPVDVIAFIVVITFIFLVIAFFVMMIVCSVAVFVLMVRRFYTSFFTDEGYLTFTLPVTVDCHLMTKTASMVIWSVISSAVTLLAVGAFVLGIYFFAPEEFVMDEYSKLYFEALWREIGNVFGGSIAFGIINVIISGISSYLLLFFSISVGCMLTKKNRFIVCAASYLIINGVVNNIISIGTGIFSFIFVGMAMNESMYDLYMMTVMLISTLLYAAQGVGCYFGTRWILKNKINLD